jgi:hypothetical protein
MEGYVRAVEGYPVGHAKKGCSRQLLARRAGVRLPLAWNSPSLA